MKEFFESLPISTRSIPIPQNLIDRYNEEFFEDVVSMRISVLEEDAASITEEEFWEALLAIRNAERIYPSESNPPHTGVAASKLTESDK